MADSYGHTCTYIKSLDIYRLSWVTDAKHAGSRLRFPRTHTRNTDADGAKRFCKKWGIDFPANAPDEDKP